MSQGDVFRFINEASEATLNSLIRRLEFRDQHATFTKWRNDYLDKLDFKNAWRVLDIGCGTGVVTRALARRTDFAGVVTGVDHSPALIETAQRLMAEAGLSERVEFKVSDIHALAYEDASFDIVVAHTVMSHVTDPFTATKELARVTKPGGKIVIFDGDYASWTFAYPPDATLARAMEEAVLKAVVNNPRVMRDLPLILHQVGLKLADVMSYVLAEVGTGNFWIQGAETFTPLVIQARLLPDEQVLQWMDWQRQAIVDQVFFSSSNFYTYMIECPIA